MRNFTFDTEAKALEAISSGFVPSFVLFRMFCEGKQQLSISATATGYMCVCVFAYSLGGSSERQR